MDTLRLLQEKWDKSVMSCLISNSTMYADIRAPVVHHSICHTIC